MHEFIFVILFSINADILRGVAVLNTMFAKKTSLDSGQCEKVSIWLDVCLRFLVDLLQWQNSVLSCWTKLMKICVKL